MRRRGRTRPTLPSAPLARPVRPAGGAPGGRPAPEATPASPMTAGHRLQHDLDARWITLRRAVLWHRSDGLTGQQCPGDTPAEQGEEPGGPGDEIDVARDQLVAVPTERLPHRHVGD